MKRWIAVLLCAALLITGPILLSANAVSNVYFIAVNDELQTVSAETTPIFVGGITYIPCTIFDRSVTKVNLGVSYGWKSEERKLTLFSSDNTLVFDIDAETAYSYSDEKEYQYKAVYQNGLPYVPASSTCRYFGITCSFLVTDDGEYQMLRLKGSNADLAIKDDKYYLLTARPTMKAWTDKLNKSAEQPSKPAIPGQLDGEGINPTEEPEEETGTDGMVYLSIRVDGKGNLDNILGAMKGNGQTSGIFFFPCEQVADYSDTLRELVGSGQRIGLIPKGDTGEAQLESLQAANRLLEHIVRQRAVFILGDGLSAETKTALGTKGYIAWQPNVTVTSQNTSDSALYSRALERIEAYNGKRARVLLDDGVKGGTLSSILRQLRNDQYDIRTPRETDY